ncbi:MAG: undecaprenyl-diphosphatase UppP [Verrucomicrobiae bacterium]|nr:undecaprenyl-diphosphatase UppP [Verrucomicrobiae bacterium]MCX7915677.1 undecaprenyl-diphosphatase UppP [Verrucomicrobiae bacterium]MDW8343898.1 undecaprenyl-diphosphatase UppP [Verrucomicrobiae bacterium]
MTVWEAAVLGVVQGLTEFLPISSTAHLAIVPALLGWQNPDLAFKAVIQLGTLAAVLWYFRRDVWSISRDVLTKGPQASLGWKIAVGTIPVVVLGVAGRSVIEQMNNSIAVMAGALVGVALVLVAAEWFVRKFPPRKDLPDAGWMDALVVGLAQAVALIPGSSRSGCTIAGALFAGFHRDAAARFSFLLSLPAIFAAGIHELVEQRHALFASEASAFNLLIATALSAVVGYASIAFLLSFLKRHTLWLFIGYRLILGLVLIALLGSGRLPNW